MKITAIIHTLNDAENLGRCLERLQSLDEILVCDLGSTDNCVEIAEKAGARVIKLDTDRYDADRDAMNVAITEARNGWVFYVDADELVPAALIDYLRGFVENHGSFSSLYIARKNYILSRFDRGSYPDYQLRFFRKEGSKWTDWKTTAPKVTGTPTKIPASRRDLALTHISVPLRNELRDLNARSEEELATRKSRNVSMLEMFVAPTAEFFSTYFLKGQFRFGRVGFINASKGAIYKFLILSKLYEQEGHKRFWKMVDNDRKAAAKK